ncbi:MAG: YkgJ family cysteine cluster protein [Desulfobulbaceae bacterium]|nr:YkgJ family cysteine cluster protein [Desulfobulbaceae bacterium]HIJ77838.1 YkgJ family cysteine cluster protein [Deltaproteobacteria bacterium]
MSEEQTIFQCRQCGHCCHGETTVSLDGDDFERMVKHLRLPAEEVKEKYLRITGNVIQMKTVDGHCIFYNEGCTIHQGKPWRCSQWPLHPSMLTDSNNFDSIRQSCPGIKGELGYEVFRSKLAEILNAEPKKSK